MEADLYEKDKQLQELMAKHQEVRPDKKIPVLRVTRPYLNLLVKPINKFQVF